MLHVTSTGLNCRVSVPKGEQDTEPIVPLCIAWRSWFTLCLKTYRGMGQGNVAQETNR